MGVSLCQSHLPSPLHPLPSVDNLSSCVSVGLSAHSCPISLSLPSLCCVRLFLTLVCLSVCPSLPFLFSPPSPLPRMAPGFWKDHPPQILPQTSPLLPTQSPGVPLHLPLSFCQPRRPAAGRGLLCPLVMPRPTYRAAACPSPLRMRSVVLPRPCSRALMIYSPALRINLCPREPDPTRHLPYELVALASFGHSRPSIHVFLLQTYEVCRDAAPGRLLGPHDRPRLP